MKVKIFFAVITLFLASFNAHADEGVKIWLETKGKQLIETFGEVDKNVKHQKLDKLLVEDIDLDYIAKFVIGKHYKNMSIEQKQRYYKAFDNYALNAYKKFPLSFGTKLEFNVGQTYKNKNFYNTKVFVKPNPDVEIGVEFVLRKAENGYKIVDIKITESSLILSYRNRFYEMIEQNDGEIDWFIEDLESIAEDKNGI